MDSARSPERPVGPLTGSSPNSVPGRYGQPGGPGAAAGRAAAAARGVASPVAGSGGAVPAGIGPIPRHAAPAPAGTGGAPGGRGAPVPVKILVAGGFGVGKTTTVGSISDIAPLTTEAEMTDAAIGIDDPGAGSTKTTTTVAMDFGSVTIDQTLKLYLFGTPGQSRFGFMWDDLARGALGALVVVDSARLDDCYPAIDYFERAELPFVVGVNAFHGQLAHDLPSIRWALAIGDHIPLVRFDARDRLSVRDALLAVLDKALNRAIRQRSG
ncbi:ATP/GTP-binding protein [Micromonospora sp. NPDC049559]|uniref:GTP-binding protein n=1 Tax=Micromonospora sp. NPDC049559 TaxID=3155923 RepID=UPI00341232EE